MAREHAGDEQRVRQAQALERKRDKQAEADFRAVMQTREGRSALWMVLGEAGIFRPSYVVGDSHATAFREGERAIGLRLLGRIQRLCPEEWGLMSSEAQAREGAPVRPETDDEESSDG